MPLARLTARKMSPGRDLLRGTVPVPDDWAGGPLHVVDSKGVSWPTTVEAVVRGPSGKPRVLYLTAVGDTTGGVQRFTVEPGAVAATEPHAVAPQVRIVSEDHRGVAYSSTIRPLTAIGNAAQTQRHAGELFGTGLAVERFLGYEAFLTTIAGEPDVVLLDIALQNGRVDAEILHHLFFKSVRLELPSGWAMLGGDTTPTWGPGSLIGPSEDGKLHPLLQGQVKDFRLALFRGDAGYARADRLLSFTGFFTCDYSLTEWSWGNPKTAWYSPMAAPMPSSSMNLLPYGANLSSIEAAMASGSPLPAANMLTPCGPFYPRGTTYGGVTGGMGIQAFQGMDVLCSSSPSESLRILMAVQSMDADRSAGMCLVGADQRAVDCAEWDLSGVQFVQFGKLNANHEGPWRRSEANQWRYQQVAATAKLPSYWYVLTAFQPYDYAHLIRGLGPSMALAWLVNDPLAKSRLGSYGAWSRLYMLEYGYGDVAQAAAMVYGGKGGLGGREHGWAGVAVLADLALADDKRRAGAAAWVKKSCDALVLCQLPSGGWQANVGGKPAQTIIAKLPAGSEPVAAAQAIEFGIFLNFVRALWVYSDYWAIPTMIEAAVRGLREYHWKPGASEPHTALPVRYYDINNPAFAKRSDAPAAAFTNETDSYQTWVVPLYALMANQSDANALAVLQMLGVKSAADLASKMPEKMLEGAGAVLGYLQASSGYVPPIIVDPPPTVPPPPPRDPPRTDPPQRTDTSIRLRSIRWTRALWERFQRAIGGRN